MGKYIASGSLTTIAATQSPLIVVGSTTIQPRVAAIMMGLLGVPGTDQAWAAQLRRSTTAATGTAATPAPNGSPQTACTTTAVSNCTVEPTYTAGFLKQIPMNPRSTFQWAAYDRDAEIACIAAANNGLGLQITQVGGGVGTALAEMTFSE